MWPVRLVSSAEFKKEHSSQITAKDIATAARCSRLDFLLVANLPLIAKMVLDLVKFYIMQQLFVVIAKDLLMVNFIIVAIKRHFTYFGFIQESDWNSLFLVFIL